MSKLCDYSYMPWTLKSITVSSANNQTIVSEWYEAQSDDVQAAFYTVMSYLKDRPPHGWDRPFVGQLRRECKGLFEIVLTVKGVQHRPIGYFSGHQEFTFIAFATERDGN